MSFESSSRTTALVTALIAVAAAAGCGDSRPAVAPVSGVLRFAGRPLADAAVMFAPVAGGRPAEGVTDADGRFELTTFNRGDGALLGAHRAAVTAFGEGPVVLSDGREEYTPAGASGGGQALPARYSDPKRSGLEYTVEYGMAPLLIDLQP